MKTLTFFIIALFLGVAVSAQTPQSFRYQAVARDNSGNILANQPVSFRISILSGSISGTITYREAHTSLTTNAFGLAELEIGKGTPVTGTFPSIDWGSNSYFVKIEMDPAGGSAYQVLSTSQLLSVPYALHAKTADNIINPLWSQSGNHIFYNKGKVGIGVTTPNSNLDVRGLNTDDGGVMNLGNSDLSHRMVLFGGRENDPYPYINWKQGDPLRFTTDEGGWSEKMRITSEGKVGIGTSNPATYIHAHGAPFPSRGQLSLSSPPGEGTFISFYEANIFKAYLWFDVSDQDLRLQNFTAGDLNLNPYGGNVGIGTNTPNSKLDVAGEINVSNNKIRNVADPVNAQDAATKAYVDTLFNELKNATMNVHDTIGTKLNSVQLDITGLIKRKVLSSAYSIHRSVDSDGQPTSKINIDYIKVRAKSLEDGNCDIFKWMCSPFEYKDGKLIYLPLNNNLTKLKELEFKRGYIISYKERYDNNGLIEEFEISPQEIKIGGASIKEVWAEEVSSIRDSNYGEIGQSKSAHGCGVMDISPFEGVTGIATSATGVNFGKYSEISSPDGYSGNFKGDKLRVESQTEIDNTVSVENHLISSLTNPVNAQNASTKACVDTLHNELKNATIPALDTIGLKLSSAQIEIVGFQLRKVLSVEYSIRRSIDSDGQPTSKVSIDNIKVRAKSPDDGNHDFFDWMCSPFESKDGKVIYLALNGTKIKELEFKRGYMISYQETYDDNGLIEEFEISPQEISMGGASIKEVWAAEISLNQN